MQGAASSYAPRGTRPTRPWMRITTSTRSRGYVSIPIFAYQCAFTPSAEVELLQIQYDSLALSGWRIWCGSWVFHDLVGRDALGAVFSCQCTLKIFVGHSGKIDNSHFMGILKFTTVCIEHLWVPSDFMRITVFSLPLGRANYFRTWTVETWNSCFQNWRCHWLSGFISDVVIIGLVVPCEIHPLPRVDLFFVTPATFFSFFLYCAYVCMLEHSC